MSAIPATRFADPTVDFVFKRIFGTETYKQNTINLINAIIQDIGIVDVKFIIEMQKASQEHFRERTLFYASKFIALLGKMGKWDYQLPPVYVVSFLDFPLRKVRINLQMTSNNGNICCRTPLH